MIESVTAIIVALIGASHLWERRRTSRVEEKQDVVISKISTNHGLEPYEYLEMIAAIKDGQEALFTLLADHTDQDARQFEELRRAISSN